MAMKLRFEADLDYQADAVEAVCGLFKGQEFGHSEFTALPQYPVAQAEMGIGRSALGVGNRLSLSGGDLLRNLNDVQVRNGLEPSRSLASLDFTVEMETGTGKTYVYTRSIFELNKRFGFTKFVVVVPSVAIKEGVYKSLQMTEDHFKSLYANTPFGYFIYDSSKLGVVRNFATSSDVQIMIVTVGAINKRDVNNLYKDSEKVGGEKPLDLIQATNPIIIVDEPQSVDGGLEGRGRAALGEMRPLCTLRYSATHADKHHMVYCLDAVDAYERKLVKQIEVASATVSDAYNSPYVRLISVESNKSNIWANVELDVATAHGVSRQRRSVQDGDDLERVTRRELYRNYRIGEIRAARGDEFVELRMPGTEHWLRIGEAHGDAGGDAVQREMIRRAIKEHLDKEIRLRPQGIKVLTLFFVERVDKYRRYDEEGNRVKGEYARIFEQEHDRWVRHPDYQERLREIGVAGSGAEAHDGYFSIDRKGHAVDTAENNQAHRDNAERGYNLIMRDKERLLSFETPLRFIFSHSALREGWDNPNVFQICSLRDIQTEHERRQTIGRGLRLCVNQDGERVRGFEINTLTVIATEPFEEFAENLQKEVESETGIRFGVIERHRFASIPVVDESGVGARLGFERSQRLWNYLREQGFLNGEGKAQDALRSALSDGTLTLPDEFEGLREQVILVLRKWAGLLQIKNADERKKVALRRAVLESAEFKELWDRIKHKTTYRVRFDNEGLIRRCADALKASPLIPAARLQWRTADIAIEHGGVSATETENSAPITLGTQAADLPDLLTELESQTRLTRRTIARIVKESERLEDFTRNPQAFIARSTEIINRGKIDALVDGVKYQKVGDGEYYAQELFETQELVGYLKNMLPDARKSAYEDVVFDSQNEERFAQQLELSAAIKVYAKLPGWFQAPTPLGPYNPDWAVVVQDENGAERLYFVVETKGSSQLSDLRRSEAMKAKWGEAHFEALRKAGSSAKYVVAKDFDEFTQHWP